MRRPRWKPVGRRQTNGTRRSCVKAEPVTTTSAKETLSRRRRSFSISTRTTKTTKAKRRPEFPRTAVTFLWKSKDAKNKWSSLKNEGREKEVVGAHTLVQRAYRVAQDRIALCPDVFIGDDIGDLKRGDADGFSSSASMQFRDGQL